MDIKDVAGFSWWGILLPDKKKWAVNIPLGLLMKMRRNVALIILFEYPELSTLWHIWQPILATIGYQPVVLMIKESSRNLISTLHYNQASAHFRYKFKFALTYKLG